MSTVQTLTEPQQSVLLGMSLLGATNAPRGVYGNIVNAEAMWDWAIAQGYIIQEENSGCNFYVLSPSGREVVGSLLRDWKEKHQ